MEANKPWMRLMDSMQDSFSPQALACIAANCQHPASNDPETNKQVVWLHNQIISIIGDRQYLEHLEELGY